jgi:hypothetical protein
MGTGEVAGRGHGFPEFSTSQDNWESRFLYENSLFSKPGKSILQDRLTILSP